MTTSVSSSTSTGMMHHMRMQRPDPSQMASKLFSKLDTSNKGYLEKSDLESAFANISGNSSTSSSGADDVFSQLDSDGDGKVTQSELKDGLSKLADQLDSQFNNMRMNGFGGMRGGQGMDGTPPPRHRDRDGEDSGFTKDQLTQQLSNIGSTDSQRSELISKIVNNFDQADSNGDGKVTRAEAMAYDKVSSATGTTTSSGSSASSDGSSNSSGSSSTGEAAIMRKLMQLMHAYGGQDNGQSNPATPFSVSA